MTAERAILPSEFRGPLMIGYLGAYTTFSTYLLESWRLVKAGPGVALANLGGSIAVGVVAVVVGLAIGRTI